MKHAILICLLMPVFTVFAQKTEFGKSDNGLIYADSTVKQLKFIVDSLNLKFKVCELNRVYKSITQAKAHYVHIVGTTAKHASKDMDANIPFDDFIKKYKPKGAEENLLVIKYKYTSYKNKEVLAFSNVKLNNDEHELEFEEDISQYQKTLKGKWVYKYYKGTKYSEESIDAFYFVDELQQQPIPDTYARMIQYSDCMIDTSAQVIYENAKESGVRYEKKETQAIKDFMDYVDLLTNKNMPEFEKGGEYERYKKAYDTWFSQKKIKQDSLKAHDPKFNQLFATAISVALAKGGTDDYFEDFVGRYYSKKLELEFKRRRRVIGGCSMDNSPRYHAHQIARLAAETVNWEIFLRSHLNIMNDRFDRMSDGSYAQEGRKTYIKELEVLDINVLDLLLGITLRIENPSKNHYYGSINRLGRALSETNQVAEIETKMLSMIADDQLDDYNRILIYHLFLNYNYNLDDKEKQAQNKIRLKEAVSKLPSYLATRIKVKDEE